MKNMSLGGYRSSRQPDLTPYVGIHSVPPSSFVVLKNGMQSTSKYWDLIPRNSFVTTWTPNTKNIFETCSPIPFGAGFVPIHPFLPN